MADVSERAQVLLMAALGMAILFVALALILNTAIYTENLATRGSEVAGGGEALRFVDTAREGLAGSIAYVNRHNDTSHDALQQNLTVAVDEWENTSHRHFVHRGRTVDVSLLDTDNGTRIAQDDPDRNFTDNSGNKTWTVAEDVNRTRNFRIHVSDADTLLDLIDADDPFNVTVANGSASWRMNVTREGTDAFIGVQNESGPDETCTFEDPAWINVTAGTVGDETCEGLEFAEGVDPPYDITFHNGSAIEGQYTLLVDNNTVETGPGSHLNGDGIDPYAAPAIYSANASVSSQTPRLYYDTSVRIVPGENDD